MTTFTIEVRKGADGKEHVTTPGIDWGRPLEILYRTHLKVRVGTQLVLRREGHSSWGGRFSLRDYSRTLYMLVKLSKELVSAESSLNGRAFTRMYATVLEEVEPGRAWRPAVAKLIARATK